MPFNFGAVWCTIFGVTEGDSVPNREADARETESREADNRESSAPRSRWETLVWPQWLPTRARLPLLAQLTGAFALMAAFTMPGWSEVSPAPPPAAAVPPPAAAAVTPPVAPAESPPPAPAPPVAPVVRARPAHLNLDFRHNFGSVDVTVTVDDKRVLDSKLEGAGKKFGVFGRRGERSFTRSLDLQPGVRVVRLRVRSEADKFDHTRVERFELGSAAVAAMRIGVDKDGLDVMIDRPPAPAPAEPAPAVAAPATALAAAPAALAAAPAPATPAVTESNAVGELYHTLRQVLMALAGFIASVASGFLFEEYLKSRNLSPFAQDSSSPHPANRSERRRRFRKSRQESDIGLS